MLIGCGTFTCPRNEVGRHEVSAYAGLSLHVSETTQVFSRMSKCEGWHGV